MRFSIRDLLWLVVVAALAVSWWIDTKRIDKAVASTEEAGRIMKADLANQKAELADKIEIVDGLQRRWRDSAPRFTTGRRLKADTGP
jgi:hypothetical protein